MLRPQYKKKIGIYQIDKVSDYYCKIIERPTVPSLTRPHNEQRTYHGIGTVTTWFT